MEIQRYQYLNPKILDSGILLHRSLTARARGGALGIVRRLPVINGVRQGGT